MMCYMVSLRKEPESTVICREGETSLALNSKRVGKRNKVVITGTIEIFTLNVTIQIPSWFFLESMSVCFLVFWE